MSSRFDEYGSPVRRYVHVSSEEGVGRYLDLLHGNFARLPEQERRNFLRNLGRDARQITDAELGFLLRLGGVAGWRERLTAAWLIGIDRRVQFRESFGQLLLDSELVYAGQGYCFAFARFGESEDAHVLATYLDRYLPRSDCFYDQLWAIGALLHIDDRSGTDYAGRFVGDGGLWQCSAFAESDPYESQRAMAGLWTFADRLEDDSI
ncbi:hypothetical protein BJF79_08800 [Actinomadura sp. CNU-125]|uniref:DUF6000 family protein n=1 Tax=Actinomadura sp. CNU-125 TaxID=1904961 RepID=UPI000965788D|nr:DUF6000 family protein [Actinomadura sp. CNU-125]OLT31882.1 hypothetical protein BJF79_08800 [Actinomadura sp. CNU-125]